jgi:hypothetical protein
LYDIPPEVTPLKSLSILFLLEGFIFFTLIPVMYLSFVDLADHSGYRKINTKGLASVNPFPEYLKAIRGDL